MLTRAQKEEQVTELKDMFGRATCVYVADFRGIDVPSVNQLRRRIRTEGEFEYRVTKNAVLRLAAEGSEVAGIVEHFRGPTAVALSYGDPAGLARIMADFAKDHESFEIKGGMLQGEVVTSQDIATLASLPSMNELRSMLIGLIQAPASKLARLLNEPAAQLARLLNAHAKV